MLISTQLVNKPTCLTHAPLEEAMGVNLDHLESCHIEMSSGEGSQRLTQFVLETLSNAEDLIAARLKTCAANSRILPCSKVLLTF